MGKLDDYKKSISASPARNILYKKAKGTIFIGLDDDAHPISNDFINSVSNCFNKDPNLGIIAFQEVRGLYESDKAALQSSKQLKSHYTTDFVAVGLP